MVALYSAVLDSITLYTPWTHRACSTRMRTAIERRLVCAGAGAEVHGEPNV